LKLHLVSYSRKVAKFCVSVHLDTPVHGVPFLHKPKYDVPLCLITHPSRNLEDSPFFLVKIAGCASGIQLARCSYRPRHCYDH